MYSQWLGDQAAFMAAELTTDIFRDIVRRYGHVFDLYQRPTTVNCTCYNATYKTFDKNHTLCGGIGTIGGYVKEPKHSFLGVAQGRPEFNQDQHQRIFAKAGPIDTLDLVIFVEAKWFDLIHNDDVLMWKPRGSPDGFELKIISNLPRMGMDNKIVFTRIDTTKNPYSLRFEATDIRKQV